MKYKLMKTSLALFLLAAALIPAAAQDSWKIWTAAASTGTVDEEDVNKVVFSGPFASFNPAMHEGVAPQIARVYFLEAEITKGAGGLPRLGGLALSRYGVCQNIILQP